MTARPSLSADAVLGPDYIPSHKIGHLAPLAVIDSYPYEFYRLAPSGVLLVSIGVGLEVFSAEDVERVYEPLERLTGELMARDVGVVVQGGVPLPLLIGPAALEQVLERIRAASGVPALATVHCVVETARALGLRNVAAANKWSDAMNASLAGFFGQAGIGLAGASARALAPAEFVRMGARDSADLAYELGRAALDANPAADGLYIGGSAWFSLPAALRLEAEKGVPVIDNKMAVLREACLVLGCWKTRSGLGAVMALA